MSLIPKGHFFWADERCYLPALNLLDALQNGDCRRAVVHLFEADGKVPPARPAFVIISLVPALFQRGIGAVARLAPSEPAFFHAVAAFNVLVSMAITVCVYGIGRLWTGRDLYALLAAFVYSLLVNANVWIRHLVPYPESTLLFLVGLWLLSAGFARGNATMGRAFLAGLLSGLAYACYPGHYSATVMNGVVAAWGAYRAETHGRQCRCLGTILAFGLGAACPTLGFEVLARSIQQSYFSDLAVLSGSVSMGDSQEGFVFLWRYLRDVEGPLGIALFSLFVVGVTADLLRRRSVGAGAQGAWRHTSDSRRRLPHFARAAIGAAVVCYLFHASMGYFFNKMVFYGRLLMVYLPLLVLTGVAAVAGLRRRAFRGLAVAGLLWASVISFGSFASNYARVTYPAEFLQRTMVRLGRDVRYTATGLWGHVDGTLRGTVEEQDPDLTMVTDTQPEGADDYVYVTGHVAANESKRSFIGVNLKFLGYVAERAAVYRPGQDYMLIAETTHPESHPFASYEGRRPWERRRLQERAFTMRIYGRKESVAP